MLCAATGMGSNTILRGKFYVIGDKKDQLWMQIWRFGFGRSVSGSVYSEGMYLTKDDEKTYWGKIEYVGEGKGNKNSSSYSSPASPTLETKSDSNALSLPFPERKSRLLVKGSVIFGGNGLEPQPIGRFILTERTSMQTEEESEEEDEDFDDEPASEREGTSDDQPFFNSDDAFQ